MPENRHRYWRPTQRQLQETQVPRQDSPPAGHGIPRFPRLRRRTQLFAERSPQSASQAEETWPEEPLVIHTYAEKVPPERTVGRSPHSAVASRLLESATSEGRRPFHDIQEAPLLYLQQSVLPAGYVQAADASQVILYLICAILCY